MVLIFDNQKRWCECMKKVHDCIKIVLHRNAIRQNDETVEQTDSSIECNNK